MWEINHRSRNFKENPNKAYDTKEAYSSASKPKYSLRPSGYCILHDADQWKHLWTRRTAILLQSETPKNGTPAKEKNAAPADYTICLSHPIKAGVALKTFQIKKMINEKLEKFKIEKRNKKNRKIQNLRKKNLKMKYEK